METLCLPENATDTLVSVTGFKQQQIWVVTLLGLFPFILLFHVGFFLFVFGFFICVFVCLFLANMKIVITIFSKSSPKTWLLQ